MMSTSEPRVKQPAKDAPKVSWALYCARRFGVPVFPCQPNGKLPLIDDWQNRASYDPIEIRELWAAHPNANIGCHMVDRLVIDIDRKKGDGQLSWDRVTADYGGAHLNETLTQETPTGGLHLILAAPRKSKNTIGKIGKHVDTRADGGYILGAGSVIDGKAYVVSHDAEIRTAPDWLLALVGAPRAKADVKPLVGLDHDGAVERATQYLLHEAPEAIEGHGGDQTTYMVAAHVKDFGLSEDKTLELMLDYWNDAKASPPWEPDDLARKVNNAYRYGTSAPGARSAEAEFELIEAPVEAPLPVRPMGDFVFSGPPPYTVRGLITAQSVVMITGTSDAGKSPLALDIGIAVAQGRPWRGHRTKRGYVLHLSTEGKAALEARIEAQRREHGIQPSDPIDFASVTLDLRTTRKDAKRIIETVRQRSAHFGVPPAMVIIDTMSHVLAGGDESNPEHTRPLIANLTWIAEATGASVPIIHHPTKSGDSDYRGHSSLINDIAALIKVEVDSATGLRTVTTPRIKDWQQIQPQTYGIKVVELMRDEHDDPVTSVVLDWDVQAGKATPAKAEAPLSPNQDRLLRACRQAVELKLAGRRHDPEAWRLTTFDTREIREVDATLSPSRISENMEALINRGFIGRQRMASVGASGSPRVLYSFRVEIGELMGFETVKAEVEKEE